MRKISSWARWLSLSTPPKTAFDSSIAARSVQAPVPSSHSPSPTFESMASPLLSTVNVSGPMGVIWTASENSDVSTGLPPAPSRRAAVAVMGADRYAPRLIAEQVLFGEDEVIDDFVANFASKNLENFTQVLQEGQRNLGTFFHIEGSSQEAGGGGEHLLLPNPAT